jgi:hypothetical protein
VAKNFIAPHREGKVLAYETGKRLARCGQTPPFTIFAQLQFQQFVSSVEGNPWLAAHL